MSLTPATDVALRLKTALEEALRHLGEGRAHLISMDAELITQWAHVHEHSVQEIIALELSLVSALVKVAVPLGIPSAELTRLCATDPTEGPKLSGLVEEARVLAERFRRERQLYGVMASRSHNVVRSLLSALTPGGGGGNAYDRRGAAAPASTSSAKVSERA